MRLKINFKFLIAPIIAIGFFLYGCVEEPTIDPVKLPYSMLRVANFTYNQSSLSVTINGQATPAGFANVANRNLSGFSKVNSGTYLFTVKNGAGDTLFNQELTISSYQRATLVFAGLFTGVYNSESLTRTFTSFFYNEGEVYQTSTPNSGKIHIYLMNTSTDSLTVAKKILTPIILRPGKTSDTSYASMDFARTRSLINADAGNYKVRFYDGTDTLSIGEVNYNLSTVGKRYFLYVYGSSNNLNTKLEAFDPLPVTSK